MARRHLSPEEKALWGALTRSVRPLRPGSRPIEMPVVPAVAVVDPGLTPVPRQPAIAAPARAPSSMLDSSWERRIRGGRLVPDISIDLHGHSLAAAHVRLNHALSSALARDLRVLLIVTGKPPKSGGLGRDSRRGAIRGEIGHWLETSPYADRIASVRLAHPRHGGEGAIYVILRRKK
jgi:DNA-nicking Smr family endonuclease